MTDVRERQLWKPEEDSLLRDLVLNSKSINWKEIASKVSEKFSTRSSKQCRDRYNNYVNPKINASNNIWTPDDDFTLARLYFTYGSKWTTIAKSMPGKSENMVKNRWNSSLSKRTHLVGNIILIDDHKGPGRTPKNQPFQNQRQCYSVPLYPQVTSASSVYSSSNNTLISNQLIDSSWRNVEGVQSFMPPNFQRVRPPPQKETANHVLSIENLLNSHKETLPSLVLSTKMEDIVV
ncbi:Myb-like DNA-binding domain containing protein [Trichomonas vaginalis G3]|uniref:Myb-like DNA-binding domain containing protein n=1 Tax=Trichomonas vaginalis (strain ATCC PRA-98 / G3) TaxID=412133 RepID=A2G8Y6_TRIV3|nr:RNA polymerase II transcription regulator recruiting protein [Trichomonas vaginalis G3]EAX86377.1 Myb-like DNA-binding domain containing protein [Trichomonas vaginalis G3]KAI5520417.1 RNA polymerase II transcription regulator recruiting protein [Trichomonas vaginalis G3]|eukprot:XP_001299307.1 Myb-like DNA-binding domain containing protein [Trichomonas vaginalis G3]